MRYPKKIKIGAHTIEIEYVKKLKYGEKDVNGLCMFGNRKILIKKGLHKQEKRDTYLHELIHCISDAYDLNLSERQVTVLTGEIISLINRNKLGKL